VLQPEDETGSVVASVGECSIEVPAAVNDYTVLSAGPGLLLGEVIENLQVSTWLDALGWRIAVPH
jgi:hypothetical protein